MGKKKSYMGMVLDAAQKPKPVYWVSPVGEVDDFGFPIKDEIIDAVTRYGPWALMSPESWMRNGNGELGTGRGQRYKKQADGKWLKVEG
jgi:hypothetical protein